MPIPEEKMRRPESLNRWFAASALLMTLSILWMIKVDYDRPWRDFQDNYFVGKAALAHLDYLDAVRHERQKEIEEAEQRLRDAEDMVAQTAGARREKLFQQRRDVNLKFSRADGVWSRKNQLLEVTRDTYEKTLGRFGRDHPETIAAHNRLVEEEEEVERLRLEKEHWEDERTEIDRELAELDEPIREAERQFRDLRQAADAALQRDREYRGVLTDEGLLGGLPIVSWIINAPLLDFTAPKTVPGRQQVKQLVLPHVRQELNYLESYTTDRCTTCHTAIDDPEFSRDRLAQKLERSLPGINEALQRLGKEPFELPAPPTIAGADRPLLQGKVAEFWDRLTRQQQDEYFETLLAFVNEYLSMTGRKKIDLGQPLLAHPDLDLFVSVRSPHSMEQMGCTVCHEGNPQETDFVQAAHTPPTHEVREKWKEEYYIRVFGVPNVTFETVEHFWDRSMHLPRYTEAGCAKCHSQISDIDVYQGERQGTRINLGRHLFVVTGCANCHDVDALPDVRRVGPDLSRVSSKLKPEFVQQWVFAPQKFRPSTLMPHFFLQENNRAESANSFDPDPVTRTRTEVAAITRYLFAVSQDWAPHKPPAGVEGDPERGRKLFKEVGCLGCHTNLAEFGEEWITRDLMEREGLSDERARHRYLAMTHAERGRYALRHFVDERESFLRPEKVRQDSDGPYQPPVISRFAPELSGVGSKVHFDWLYSWLLEPTHYLPEARMPSLRLSPQEAADIAAYLLTLRNDEFVQETFELNEARLRMLDDQIFMLLSALRSERRSLSIMRDEGGELTDMLVTLLKDSLGREKARQVILPMDLIDKKLMYLGSRMITHYGCYACHTIPGFEHSTPPGTELSTWAEKPISQLDFAFYDDAFKRMRKEKDHIYGYVYPRDAEMLNRLTPLAPMTREQISHTHAAFAKHKMLNPRIWDRGKLREPYDKLIMPNYYFTQEEAEALTTYLLSRVSPRVENVLTVDYDGTELGPIARGRNLTRELNCVGCHRLEDNIPHIEQFYRRRLAGREWLDETNAPPRLWGEGAKVQHQWLHGFLQHVEPLRPWLAVRMPTFNLTSEQTTDLVQYFAALSRHESTKLTQWTRPVWEYIEGQRDEDRTRIRENPPREGPGSEWFQQDPLHDSAAELRRWAIKRNLMRRGDLDPLETLQARFRAAHADMLKRAEFVQKLFDVEFPFVEPPAPLSAPERFERGFRFFEDMGCLQCHVLGDMRPGPAKNTDEFVQMYRLDGVRGEGEDAVAIINGKPYPVGSVIDSHVLISAERKVYEDSGDVDTKAVFEGPDAAGEPERILLVAPSAPNLSLTYERLRRTWVFNWMLEPQWIQPGTKMPQNFPGGVSPFEGLPEYPGTGIDHINLLVDFLYHAGATRTRAELPKIVVSEEPEEFDEEAPEEEFFDDFD